MWYVAGHPSSGVTSSCVARYILLILFGSGAPILRLIFSLYIHRCRITLLVVYLNTSSTLSSYQDFSSLQSYLKSFKLSNLRDNFHKYPFQKIHHGNPIKRRLQAWMARGNHPFYLLLLATSLKVNLQIEKALGTRPLLTGSADDIRQQFDGLITILASQMPPPDTSIQTRDESADGVPVRIYTPPNSSGKPLPLGVYYHGGGYCVGNLDSEDFWCRYIAKSVPCVIVSVDYRLGPKHKMPAIFDDSVKAFEWVCNYIPSSLSIDTPILNPPSKPKPKLISSLFPRPTKTRLPLTPTPPTSSQLALQQVEV